MSPLELPVIGAATPERADAARNRARILEAAQRLFAEQGVGCTSMDDIAAAAGVGKGTLFRRFGDRASLAFAVLGDSERDLQDAILSGPPPLGPGAAPCERLTAFSAALLDQLERNGEILLDAERGGRAPSFMRSAPFAVHWMHMRNLVREASPDQDCDYLADVLLLPLTPSAFAHQRHARGRSLEQLKSDHAELIDRLLGER